MHSACGFGQTRGQDPDQLRGSGRPDLGPGVCEVVLHGRVRQAQAVGGCLLRPGNEDRRDHPDLTVRGALSGMATGPARHALRTNSSGTGGSARRMTIGRSLVEGLSLSPRPVLRTFPPGPAVASGCPGRRSSNRGTGVAAPPEHGAVADVERRAARGQRHDVIDGQVARRVGVALVARAPVPMLATPGAEHSGAEALPCPRAVQGVVPAAVGLPRVLEAATARAAGDDTTDRAQLHPRIVDGVAGAVYSPAVLRLRDQHRHQVRHDHGPLHPAGSAGGAPRRATPRPILRRRTGPACAAGLRRQRRQRPARRR